MKSEKINMMEFLGKKIHNNKKIGTPTKKVKPNEDNESVDSDFDIPFGNLLFIKNISKTESSLMINKKQQSAFQISQFSLGNNPEFLNENKENDLFHINKAQSYEQSMDEQKDYKQPPKMIKRINSVEKCPTKEYDNLLTELSLTKHNSTFPMVDFAGFENEEEFGENIYLNQLLTLKAKISLTDANNENREILRNVRNNHDKFEDNRLEKDYEIKENLGRYQPNKEGFICLNKLEKIFYYVKKTSLTKGSISSIYQNPHPITHKTSCLQSFLSTLSTSRRQTLPLELTSLIRSQIKLYNRDSDSRLVRFYQEWIERNQLFMIYELGSYSVADKILSGQKLPESEVWGVLYDLAEGLKWVYDCGKLHMNLKPGNIVKCRGKYKLADPIVEKEFVQGHIQQIASANQQFYLAPELVEFQTFLQGIDFSKCEIYSLGMSILENITAMSRSMKNCSHFQLKTYFKKQLHGYSSFLKRLLLRMIDTNYKKRPTFDELLCSNIEENLIEKRKFANQIKFKRANSI